MDPLLFQGFINALGIVANHEKLACQKGLQHGVVGKAPKLFAIRCKSSLFTDLKGNRRAKGGNECLICLNRLDRFHFGDLGLGGVKIKALDKGVKLKTGKKRKRTLGINAVIFVRRKAALKRHAATDLCQFLRKIGALLAILKLGAKRGAQIGRLKLLVNSIQ